jgi:hypothetical protein
MPLNYGENKKIETVKNSESIKRPVEKRIQNLVNLLKIN